jgi:hypothetical protein
MIWLLFTAVAPPVMRQICLENARLLADERFWFCYSMNIWTEVPFGGNEEYNLFFKMHFDFIKLEKETLIPWLKQFWIVF